MRGTAWHCLALEGGARTLLSCVHRFINSVFVRAALNRALPLLWDCALLLHLRLWAAAPNPPRAQLPGAPKGLGRGSGMAAAWPGPYPIHLSTRTRDVSGEALRQEHHVRCGGAGRRCMWDSPGQSHRRRGGDKGTQTHTRPEQDVLGADPPDRIKTHPCPWRAHGRPMAGPWRANGGPMAGL